MIIYLVSSISFTINLPTTVPSIVFTVLVLFLAQAGAISKRYSYTCMRHFAPTVHL